MFGRLRLFADGAAAVPPKAFGPYLPGVRDRLDYSQARCPTSDLICTQSIWLEHSLLLGTADDMDEIAAAFEKIHRHRDELGPMMIERLTAALGRLDRNRYPWPSAPGLAVVP